MCPIPDLELKSSPELPHVPSQILIVDDHASTRHALRLLIEHNPDWEVCGEAIDGMEAVELAKQKRPDLIVMDISMPRMDGLRAAEKIAEIVPRSRVLLISLYTSDERLLPRQAGIWGLVHKQNAAHDLPEAMAAVLLGNIYFPQHDTEPTRTTRRPH